MVQSDKCLKAVDSNCSVSLVALPCDSLQLYHLGKFAKHYPVFTFLSREAYGGEERVCIVRKNFKDTVRCTNDPVRCFGRGCICPLIYMFVRTSRLRHSSLRGPETSSGEIRIDSRLAAWTFFNMVNNIPSLEAIGECVGFLSRFLLVSIHLRVRYRH